MTAGSGVLIQYFQPTKADPLPAHMGVLDPKAEVYPDACRRLWAAVFQEAWRQAFRPYTTESPAHVAAARRWFGTRDFVRVCGFLELDPDDVMRAFRRSVEQGAVKQPIRRRA